MNDHQVDFVRLVAERTGTILPVYEIEMLEDMIVNFNRYEKEIKGTVTEHNKEFNEAFEKIVDEMMS